MHSSEPLPGSVGFRTTLDVGVIKDEYCVEFVYFFCFTNKPIRTHTLDAVLISIYVNYFILKWSFVAKAIESVFISQDMLGVLLYYCRYYFYFRYMCALMIANWHISLSISGIVCYIHMYRLKWNKTSTNSTFKWYAPL